MKSFPKICLGCLLLTPVWLWAQTSDTHATPVPAVVGVEGAPDGAVPQSTGDPMLTPPPVSGQSYPRSFASEERANYLRGGLVFTGAYSDNVLGSLNGHAIGDESYSVAPTMALDESTPRMHTVLTYAPGFTFYQHTGERNEQDQNVGADFGYRLSPHVTFGAQDSFQKSSNVFNQPDLASATVSGGAQVANFSVVAPVADRLSNSGNLGLSYQFAANSMVGVGGTFTNLHYPNPAEVPGLFDAASQAGSAFYAVRISKMHYVGVAYEYQRLLAYPAGRENETQTHAELLFYTVYPTAKFSVSAFGGPQYSEAGPQYSTTGSISAAAAKSWSPAAGGSLSWQGQRSALAFSYAHVVASGGGLIGAVRLDNAGASLRQQLTRTLSASLSASYAQNDLLAVAAAPGYNGHTVSGTAALQRQIRQNWNVQLGCTRLHEDYSSVAVLATTPNTNREFISISYQFSRPLGR